MRCSFEIHLFDHSRWTEKIEFCCIIADILESEKLLFHVVCLFASIKEDISFSPWKERRFFDDRINFSLPWTDDATVRKEKEESRQRVTLFSCNSRLSKKKAALRYFPSLDNIGNTIFSGFITLNRGREKMILQGRYSRVGNTEKFLLNLPMM